jgi:hypothetical protein
MKNKWVFMDETGVIAHDPQQRYFALGMLKLEETATLYQELNLLMQRARSKVNPVFEFKFNRINSGNKDFYIALVDLFFRFPELYYKMIVVDKQHSKLDLSSYPSTYEAQTYFTGQLLQSSVDDNEQVAVVMDYVDKPKAVTRYLETEVMNLPRLTASATSLTFNACMIESTASLFIQLVDVLLGLTVFDFKGGTNRERLSVVNALKTKLGVNSLVQSKVFNTTPHFEVLVYEPK